MGVPRIGGAKADGGRIYLHAVIHNVRVYLSTGDERVREEEDEKRMDREGRAEDDRHDQGSWDGMIGEFEDLREVRRQRSDRELATKEEKKSSQKGYLAGRSIAYRRHGWRRDWVIWEKVERSS